MRQRLLLLINSLEGGGAEKIMVRLAEELSAQAEHFEVHLGLLDDVADAYAPPSTVELHRLGSRGSFLRSVSGTRQLIANLSPDVVLSFLTRANCAAVLSRSRGPFRCVISERVNTSSHLGRGARAVLLKRLITALYPRADAIVAVSSGVSDELRQNYHVATDRLHVIHNPVDAQNLRAQANEEPVFDLPSDFFVSVGRLVPNKGAEPLIRAFAAHRNTTRCLVLLGEGPERETLHELSRSLGVADRVMMPGHIPNPHAVVARATAYVSASRSEGFPNALVEAMALGCPVVATDCQSGPAEILADAQTGIAQGKLYAPWGILVPVDDTAAMASAMDDLDASDLRKQLSEKSRERAESFDVASVVRNYMRVLRNCEI
ncbi:glycosyltransferase [Pseudoruegeria sp. SHC-113]|uniref:glycosyltransferase n=1 Tax=Pseudoruegeria sp. SHC-113 TaxID=2855439 RepID=UPI0021BBA734|nr:glycosyltransferase [Pseudoruegeria sp. SHC-113]MCT8158633.1 glycosyltransferase [Pseudoruegeria sp. SHC-113]